MRQINSKSITKRFSLFTLFAVIALAGVFFAKTWWATNSAPPLAIKPLYRFVITKGSSGTLVGNNLYKQGFIKSPLAFKIYIQLNGFSARIQAGEYKLGKNMSLVAVVNTLLKGPSGIWVTIPEGLRREEIPFRFANALNLGETETKDFVLEFNQSARNDEGYLFPETYLVQNDLSGAKAYQIMRATFDKQVDSQLKEDAAKTNYTLHELITLASIIERETKSPEERPIVAGIYFNRLQIGMALQADATVQYAIGNICYETNSSCNWWKTPTGPDLDINSAYNTYKNAGLPPFPISNPGLTSIKGVIYPNDNNYLYYIHDAKGNIHYAETLEQHNANVVKYLR